MHDIPEDDAGPVCRGGVATPVPAHPCVDVAHLQLLGCQGRLGPPDVDRSPGIGQIVDAGQGRRHQETESADHDIARERQMEQASGDE